VTEQEEKNIASYIILLYSKGEFDHHRIVVISKYVQAYNSMLS